MSAAGGGYLAAMLALAGLCGVHAWCKLSPAFARRWFTSAVLFAVTWRLGGRLGPPSGDPLAVAAPLLVIYLAAAVTKGIVEATRALAGRHAVHVVMTGLFAAAIAWPHEALWSQRGWVAASPPRAALAAWGAAALVFYGTYKLVDHAAWPDALRWLVLVLAMPGLGAVLAAFAGA